MVLDYDDDDEDFEDGEYIELMGPDDEKYLDGAKIVVCRICGAHLLVAMYSESEDCGTHEAWRCWFSRN